MKFNWSIACLILGSSLLCSCVLLTKPTPSRELSLWYDAPAPKDPLVPPPGKKPAHKIFHSWQNWVLPVGNGFMGAMIYGGVEQEVIQINDKTLWSGGPGTPGWKQDINNPEAYGKLSEIRRLVLDGKRNAALKLAKKYLTSGKPQDFTPKGARNRYFGYYQNLGSLIFETGQKDFTDYRRALDISRALHTVSYKSGQTNFKRTVFCSYPDRCTVVRFSADTPGKINLSFRFLPAHPANFSAKNNVLVVRGAVKANGLKYDLRIGVSVNGGTAKVTPEGISVTGADSAAFYLCSDTDYAPVWPKYRGEDPAAKNAARLAAAMQKGYKQLLVRHEADYRKLFDRVVLDLGPAPAEAASLPTDKRMDLYKKKPLDHDLEALYFQYGRYLMIASSRPGTLPANLQGVWNNSNHPPWNCDYHFDINVEMNYWLSWSANLTECQHPLINYIDGLRVPGARTAQVYYRAPGWTANIIGNVWGFTTPTPGHLPRFWSYFPIGGPWLATHAWEQYAYDGDKEYLRKKGWPILKGSADFLCGYLYKLPSGEYVSCPSWSPEHKPISIGTFTDASIARELLTDAIKAAEELDYKGPEPQKWRQVRDAIVPFKIGKYGQLQEWYRDIDNPKSHHRHINHLYGAFPGTQITPDRTPKLAEAVKTTLTQRGDKSTGWGQAWRACLWAALRDGDHAYRLIQTMLNRSTSYNLFDICPPFQIDGNFGAPAGMANMLLQSFYSPDSGAEVHLLPALPSAWPEGHAIGLLARGALTVDQEWKNGRLVSATIHAKVPRKVRVIYGKKSWNLQLEAGKTATLYPESPYFIW